MTSRIYLFPGQGSQQAGMGAGVFPKFKELTDQASSELGYSIEKLCREDPQKRLDQTEFTQPALYVVSCLIFLERLTRDGKLPHYVAGHSLGEYSALFAAGVFDFVTGLRLVKQRGLLMSQARDGAMAAVIGLGGDTIRATLGQSGLASIDLANYNSPSQIVISGPAHEIDQAVVVLQGAGAQMVRRLKVSAAFHSRYMAPAEQNFSAFLEDFNFSKPRIPVLSNVTAAPHSEEMLKKNLAGQITRPVRWTESVQWLLNQPSPEFSEIGPGNVLTGLLRRIQSETTAGRASGQPVATPK